jgi:hypothetical protein
VPQTLIGVRLGRVECVEQAAFELLIHPARDPF